MSIAVGNEKTFEHFSELLPEIRSVVIDEMQSIDRCRLTRCSKLCYIEAKYLKKYIYGISLLVDPNTDFFLQIIVIFGQGEFFKLRFQIDPESGEQYKKYLNWRNEELWKLKLNNSIDMIQHGAEHFKNILRVYQNKIQSLSLDLAQNFPVDFNFEINSLKNLTELKVFCDWDMSHLFSKLRKPLKNLVVKGKETSRDMANFEQIFQVQDFLHLYDTKLNYEQLKKLSATKINIPIGHLTEMDIFLLIRCWQNRTDEERKIEYRLGLSRSNFNKQQLLNLLEIAQNPAQKFPIKHYKDEQKMGELWFHLDALVLTLN